MFRYLKLLFCLKKYEQNQLMAKGSQYNLYNKPQRNTIRQSCSYPSWPRGYGSLIPNPCSYNNIYSPLSGFQSYCCQLIHFCCGPNTCSHYTKQWHRTYLIHDAPLSRSAQCALTLLHKSSRTHRSCQFLHLNFILKLMVEGLLLLLHPLFGKHFNQSLDFVIPFFF